MEKSRKKLPAGWEMKTLGEVCSYINRGISPKYIESGGLRVLNQKCIRDHRVNMELGRFHNNLIKIVPEERYIKYGDVLVNSTGTGTLGRVAQVLFDSNATVDSHVTIVRSKPNLFVLPYFGYGMIAIEEEIAQRGQGCGGQIELSRDDLKKAFYISYPQSHYEQQRIVAKLDEAFAEIAAAKANIERNLQNCKEVFQCALTNELCSKKEEWQIKKLGEVCEKVEYGSSTKSKEQGSIAVLRMGNIQNGRFTFEDLVYSDNEEENQKYLLKYNDVLFNRTNSPELVGKTAIYKGELPAIFAGYLIRIHRKETLLDADYLNYYLNSEMAKDYGKTVVISSVNQANINGTKLKEYPIPLPSLAEQQCIVKRLDILSLQCKQMEESYQQKLSSLEELKKSILQKAFSGEL